VPGGGGGGASGWNNNSHALEFDGTDDYVALGNSSDLAPSNITVSLWFKASGSVSSYNYLFAREGATYGSYLLRYTSANKFNIFIGHTSSVFTEITSSSTYTLTDWHHVAFTYDQTNLKLYVDGSEAASVAKTTAIDYTPSTDYGSDNTYIGKGTFADNAEGLIDEVAIFNTALSASQITNIYRGEDDGGSGGTNGVPGDLSTFNSNNGPVGWWRMGDNDGGTGTTITDQGSGGNDGTLTNGPTFSTDVPTFNTYSVDFDGTDDYMDFGTNTTINSSSAFSVSAWFNVDNISSYPTICLLKTNLTKGFVISLSNTTGGNAIYNGVWFGSATNEFKGFATANSTLSASLASGWHHLVLTYDGVSSTSSSSFSVYFDGVNYAANQAVGLGSYANVNHVGKGAYQFDGLIDEFAIFNSELSSSDVTAIYNSGVPADLTSYSPVGWWRMGDNDGGTGTTITDQGSGGNNGTLTNGPTFSTTVPS